MVVTLSAVIMAVLKAPAIYYHVSTCLNILMKVNLTRSRGGGGDGGHTLYPEIFNLWGRQFVNVAPRH
jgi:hypothetical protein